MYKYVYLKLKPRDKKKIQRRNTKKNIFGQGIDKATIILIGAENLESIIMVTLDGPPPPLPPLPPKPCAETLSSGQISNVISK